MKRHGSDKCCREYQGDTIKKLHRLSCQSSRYSCRILTKVSIGFRKYLKNQIPWKLARCQISTHLWFMQDAVPHVLSAVREFLRNEFPEQWIGQGGPTFWSARFSDLNPLYFCLCRLLKSTVYTTEASGIQGLLQQRIQNGFEMIRTIPGIFRPVR